MKIEKINKHDIKYISEINIICKNNDYRNFMGEEFFNNLSLSEEIRWREEWLFDNNKDIRIGYKSIINNEIVGYIISSLADKRDSKSGLEINEIFVLPEFRGRYISFKLIDKILNTFPEKCKDIIVYNFKESKSNSYYKSLGGRSIRTDIQKVSGLNKAVTIFKWDYNKFHRIVKNKLKKEER